MKFLKALNIFVGAVLLLSVVITANNITWGYISPYDRILATDYVIKKSGSWFTTQTEHIFYPPKGHINYVILSAIRVYDRGGAKNFGYVSLAKGGPGHRNATLYFKSQRGKGLNFTVQYFGR